MYFNIPMCKIRLQLILYLIFSHTLDYFHAWPPKLIAMRSPRELSKCAITHERRQNKNILSQFIFCDLKKAQCECFSIQEICFTSQSNVADRSFASSITVFLGILTRCAHSNTIVLHGRKFWKALPLLRLSIHIFSRMGNEFPQVPQKTLVSTPVF